jgi:predicted nucleic acid-binding protein
MTTELDFVLIDTNILVRLSRPNTLEGKLASSAVNTLHQPGHLPCVLSQNLFEFWVVATRPISQNGLGLDIEDAAKLLDSLKSVFYRFPDDKLVYPAWEFLVQRHSVIGKPSHDARLVAAMKVHGIHRILTLDRAGFSRFSGITIHTP